MWLAVLVVVVVVWQLHLHHVLGVHHQLQPQQAVVPLWSRAAR